MTDIHPLTNLSYDLADFMDEGPASDPHEPEFVSPPPVGSTPALISRRGRLAMRPEWSPTAQRIRRREKIAVCEAACGLDDTELARRIGVSPKLVGAWRDEEGWLMSPSSRPGVALDELTAVSEVLLRAQGAGSLTVSQGAHLVRQPLAGEDGVLAESALDQIEHGGRRVSMFVAQQVEQRFGWRGLTWDREWDEAVDQTGIADVSMRERAVQSRREKIASILDRGRLLLAAGALAVVSAAVGVAVLCVLTALLSPLLVAGTLFFVALGLGEVGRRVAVKGWRAATGWAHDFSIQRDARRTLSSDSPAEWSLTGRVERLTVPPARGAQVMGDRGVGMDRHLQ